MCLLSRPHTGLWMWTLALYGPKPLPGDYAAINKCRASSLTSKKKKKCILMKSRQWSSYHVNVAWTYRLHCGGVQRLADWLYSNTSVFQLLVFCLCVFVFPEHSSRIWSCGFATVIRLATGQTERNIPFPLHSSFVFHSHPSSPMPSFLQSHLLLIPFSSVHALPVSSGPSSSPICLL